MGSQVPRSAVMIAQRGPTAAPVLQAVAEALPFDDGAFDAAMALLTVHHWADPTKGLAELRRVARTVIVVSSSVAISELWLTRTISPPWRCCGTAQRFSRMLSLRPLGGS